MASWFALGVIVAAGLVCFAFNGLHGDFVHDDVFAERDNADINSAETPWINVFLHDFWGKDIR